MALLEQLGDDSWQMVCVACCLMALVFAIVHLYNFLKFIFYCFCSLLFYLFV